MRGQTAAALVTLWFAFSLAFYFTGSYWVASLALAFTLGVYLADRWQQ